MITIKGFDCLYNPYDSFTPTLDHSTLPARSPVSSNTMLGATWRFLLWWASSVLDGPGQIWFMFLTRAKFFSCMFCKMWWTLMMASDPRMRQNRVRRDQNVIWKFIHEGWEFRFTPIRFLLSYVCNIEIIESVTSLVRCMQVIRFQPGVVQTLTTVGLGVRYPLIFQEKTI